MADRVFITGATGFVGSAVARIAAERGIELVLLTRKTSRLDNLVGLERASRVIADMSDEAALTEAMAGARFCFHVAADYRLWAKDPNEIIRHNVEGTKAVMRAARANGVERVVYTSSVATLEPHEGRPATEADRHEADSAIGAYKKSKVLAERVVEKMVAEEGLPAVIVSPSTPIGPRDIKPTPTGRIIVEAASGRMPAFVDTGLNLVHVEDVAMGHFLALEKGRIGENYILGGEDVSLRDMLAEIARLAGRKAPTVALPRGPIYPFAWIAERIASVTGKAPFATIDALKMSRHHMFFSSAKARAELGYHARPHKEALATAYDWFKLAGYIK